MKAKNKGFSLVELVLVIAIGALLALLGIPKIQSLITSGKVEPTGNDIVKTAAAIRATMAGQGATPYTNIGAGAAANAVFANTARGLATTLTVAGTGATATVTHDIGTSGAAITTAQGNLGAAGDSFTVTLPTVSVDACPGLATQVSKSAEVISINGTVVKANGGNYNGGSAQNACTDGNTNTFVFTFR